MLNVAVNKSGLLVVGLSVLLASCASTKTPEDARATVTAAETTLGNFLRDPDMKWLQTNLPKARAVMACPSILQAGFIVGGSGGSCVVLSRSASGSGWHGPAFYKITTGSVGFQAGAQSTEMVALVMSEKALNSLLSSSFKMGGDVSVSAGPVGTGAATALNSDLVTFVKAKGLYGGLNFDGSAMSVDDAGNQNFYGHAATPVDILVKGTVNSPNSAGLVRALGSGQ
jgi:lipid-binding SYLF domain-containing protein